MWSWPDLRDVVKMDDSASRKRIEQILGGLGVDNYTSVVLYDNSDGQLANQAFEVLRIFGHQDVLVMEGGRRKWTTEERALSAETPDPIRKTYRAKCRNEGSVGTDSGSVSPSTETRGAIRGSSG